ncbi:MAG: hypothetical protein JJT81_15750 [Rubellimicrobium sp.]|nr:hypothetical protein [Rubellimicrobium sp.]
MSRIDDVIIAIPTMIEGTRNIWATNAACGIARGPRCNPADALRLRDAIAAHEATRSAQHDLIAACGLYWDRAIKDRTSFRGFDEDRLVARITRIKPGNFVVLARGGTLPCPFNTLSTACAAAAGAFHSEEDDTPAALPRAA